MSQRHAESARAHTATQRLAPVRMPLSVRASSRRSIAERVALRLPGLVALISRLIFLLPPRSWLRQVTLRHTVEQGVEAYNRSDYAALRPTYHANVEVVSEPQAVALGFEPVYHGFAGWLEYSKRWNAEWGDYQVEPEELIDLGDGRLLATGHQRALGSGSNAATRSDWAALWTFSAGQVIREQYFFDRQEAFKAVGLGQ